MSNIWVRWINQNPGLPADLCQRIEESQRLVISAASLYEFVWLVQRRRVQLSLPVDAWLQAATADISIDVLPITSAIACRAASLPMIHRDPLDRLIIATALENSLALMSLDEQFTRYTELQDLLIHQV